jgi:hypothetical protein
VYLVWKKEIGMKDSLKNRRRMDLGLRDIQMVILMLGNFIKISQMVKVSTIVLMVIILKVYFQMV